MSLQGEKHREDIASTVLLGMFDLSTEHEVTAPFRSLLGHRDGSAWDPGEGTAPEATVRRGRYDVERHLMEEGPRFKTEMCAHVSEMTEGARS